MQFRPIQCNDLQEVAKILAQAGNTIWTSATTPSDVSRFLRGYGVKGFVIEDGGRPIAVSFAIIGTDECMPPGVNNPFIGDIAQVQFAVAADRRGQGVGKKLVQHTLAEIRDCRRIMLHVTMDNLPAIYLYLQAGFQFESVERAGYLGRDQYIMSIVKGRN